MYKDLRAGASTPEGWAENFASRPRLQDALSRMRLRRDPRWDEIRRRVPRGARILDAGSGLGEWVEFASARGYEAIGLDYSEALIATARRRYPARSWLRGSIDAVPLPDASVDAVISWGVVEHDEAGPQRALAEFRRILRPGGHVFVTVPIDTEPMRRASIAQFGRGSEFFQYFFSPDELAAELRAAGFAVEAVRVTSRHFAPVAPRLHATAAALSPLLRDLLSQLLRPYVARRAEAACMLMAVGRRPSPDR